MTTAMAGNSFKARLSSILILILFCISCAATSEKQSELPLRFIAAVEIPTNAKQDSVPIGGLSSADYDPETNVLTAISDNTGTNGGPRLHHFDLAVTSNSLNVTSKAVTFITDANGNKLYPEFIIDAEAHAVLASGDYIIASEGIDFQGYFSLPALLEFDSKGKLLGEWPIPKKYFPKGMKLADYGVRNNDAFESLAITPDKRTMYMGNEKAMYQDGDIPGLNNESPVRILEYNTSVKVDLPMAEFAYHISPLGKVNDSDDTTGFRSLSDFMVLEKGKLITIEKTFFTGPVRKNSVQLYMAQITPATTNIAGYESLSGMTYTPVSKQLWIDLDQFEGTENFPNLDNVEGITFGPNLPNGNKTLIILTDNNFTERQRTLIYAFEVVSL